MERPRIGISRERECKYNVQRLIELFFFFFSHRRAGEGDICANGMYSSPQRWN